MLSVSRLSCVGAVSVGLDMEEGEWIRKVCEQLQVQRRRPAGRPRKTRRNVVEENLRALRLKELDASNHDLWRTAIKGDPSNPAVPG